MLPLSLVGSGRPRSRLSTSSNSVGGLATEMSCRNTSNDRRRMQIYRWVEKKWKALRTEFINNPPKVEEAGVHTGSRGAGLIEPWDSGVKHQHI